MLFVATMNVKPGAPGPKERIARRAQWKYPEGVKVIGEYWLQGKPAVISICEVDNIAPIIAMTAEWGDVFDINVFPAVTAEEGLALASQMS